MCIVQHDTTAHHHNTGSIRTGNETAQGLFIYPCNNSHLMMLPERDALSRVGAEMFGTTTGGYPYIMMDMPTDTVNNNWFV